ncbi:ribosome maturation factor RimM [Diaphorobacter ruginosibacter]|uniref:Ribosome maturation factor RimM n=1 Tax=Diaphorobacter ruginosibacter TaxID=1715720 RepID=A0A7G9RR83_9BURK|nr:ribosome maturation factor RimM [Diaphorobacter ruginosibacter]QNN58108.1 ribosome maturation factor RimM [Diaphorobacter ruginosibacter]
MPAELPVLQSATLPSDAVEVGRIGEAWGIKGWFKIVPYSADPEALLGGGNWYLQPSEKGAKSFFSGTVLLSVKQAREHSDSIVATAEEIPDRNGAEALRGARIFISRADFPKAADDEYYWVDLIGLDVLNREGVSLGVVKDLMSTGPQTTLVLSQEVSGDKPVERMIPFVSAFVDKVDIEGRRITVDWQPDY